MAVMEFLKNYWMYRQWRRKWKDWGKKIKRDHPEIKHADITFALETDTKKLRLILIGKNGAWYPIESMDLTEKEVPLVRDILTERNRKIMLEQYQDKHLH